RLAIVTRGERPTRSEFDALLVAVGDDRFRPLARVLGRMGADVDRLLAARPKGFGADDAGDGLVDAALCGGGVAVARTGDGDHHDDGHQGHRDDAGGYPDLPWLQFVERR